MRIEGGTYPLAIRSTRPTAHQGLQATEALSDARNRRLPPPRPAEGTDEESDFAETLMNVSVAPRSIHHTALLFEVQRLAQFGHAEPSLADAATDATLAYRDALDRNGLPRRRPVLASAAHTLQV